MSNSTTNLDTISSSQATKEVTANAMFDALSPASLFGRRATTTSALTWGYYGGTINADGIVTQVANGTVALSASNTNYVECNRTGVVSKNVTNFTAGNLPLYTIVAGASTVTSYTDYRALTAAQGVKNRAVANMPSDANYTLTYAESRCDIVEIISAVSLTLTRNVVVPLAPMQWTVFNNTTGAQALQFIGASGTGITVGSGKRAIIYSDGTNVVRVTADN